MSGREEETGRQVCVLLYGILIIEIVYAIMQVSSQNRLI